MKNLIILSTATLFLFGAVACKNNEANEGDAASMDTSTMMENQNMSGDGTMMNDSASGNGMTSDNMGSSTMAGNEGYIDLSTGRPVHKDEATGRYVADDNQPVDFYVNTVSLDTFFNEGDIRTTGAMRKDKTNKWGFDKSKVHVQRDGDIKMKDGDRKVKIDKDGDIKIKDANGKTKIDADDGEVKHK